MPGIKEEFYTITPIVDGAINLAYFEEICSVKNRQGEEVGICFAELLPHQYDDNKQEHSILIKSFLVCKVKADLSVSIFLTDVFL